MSENTDNETKQGAGRRDFLKALTGVSAVAAAAVVGGGAPVEAQSQPAAAAAASGRESKEERVKARYQPDAPDVQAYYRTNRY